MEYKKPDRANLKKRVEYMLLSKNKYDVRLDLYVVEDYDENGNVSEYKLQYTQNEIGLEIIGPAKCLIPFWMVDNKQGEMKEIIAEEAKKNHIITEEEAEELWFDKLEQKLDNRYKELEELFKIKR